MTTGRIEYSPDYKSNYKSKSQVKRIAAQQGNTLVRTDELIKEINERQRLEREVIDKAKLWAAAILKGAYAQMKADDELRDALNALETFEANQK